jgi:predicted CxxxxCH...CXXCH cytochrome family protein
MIDRVSSSSFTPSSSLVRAVGFISCCLAVGCLTPREESTASQRSCAGNCHGTGSSAAPPTDTQGNSATTSPGVGAHTYHLTYNATHLAVFCDNCHKVPKTVDEPGHTDHPSPAILTFSGMATTTGRQPHYDPATHTCADTYCHSGPVGSSAWPAQAVWNQPRDSQGACGSSCHALPPGGSHPKSSNCELCHSGTAGPNHTIKDHALHINGKVDVAVGGCNGCHGNDKNAAPPVDLSGSSDTTSLTVGAHQSHLVGNEYLPAVTCETCHKVPTALDTPGHIDTPSPAELTFSGMATTSGAVPVWNRATAACTNVYCHGATLPGGSNVAPTWTKVDGSQSSCGTCHGVPPAAPHPAAADTTTCKKCHQGAMDPNTNLPLLATHINGKLELFTGTDCTLCHGSKDNPAPPLDLSGSSDTTVVTVGAHQSHLKGDGLYLPAIPCDSCHKVPATVDAAGHMDTNSPAELTFSGLSTSSGAAPVWDRTAATCAQSYCHGATLTGGSNTAPTWTKVDGSQASCGACHGLPPPAPHPTATGIDQCGWCHRDGVDPATKMPLLTTHINGKIEFYSGADCTTCHGSATNPAPPNSLSGKTDPTDMTVGAHQFHLKGGTMSRPVLCTECHVVPASLWDPGHIDDGPPAKVVFSGVATTKFANNPVWDRTTGTCAGTACHPGATLGGSATPPVWNQPGSAGCGTCHGFPPPNTMGGHPATSLACNSCHPSVVNASMQIIAPEKHINGVVDY